MDISKISSVAAYDYQTQKAAQSEKSDSAQKKETAQESGVVYEKRNEAYKADNAALIEQMKADLQQRTNQMQELVQSMMLKQGNSYGAANDIWKFLASGNYTVSPEVKAQAQKDIAEDGYWGVEQTSDRILDFAKALTGGDASKAEEMRAAFEKGFKQAAGLWGGELPSISKDTYNAVMKKFDEWAGVTETQGEV